MPYNKSSMLLQRRAKLVKQLDRLKECVRVAEEQLEELDEVVRTRGPYMRPNNTTRDMEDFGHEVHEFVV